MVSEFPVIVISGARQVGKSTMLQMIKEDNMNYVTLDDLDARNLALSDPKYFLEQYSYPLLIDEIQYAPNLLPYIKMIVDDEKFKALKNNTEVKSLFWLTGSQQFKVMTTGLPRLLNRWIQQVVKSVVALRCVETQSERTTIL